LTAPLRACVRQGYCPQPLDSRGYPPRPRYRRQRHL